MTVRSRSGKTYLDTLGGSWAWQDALTWTHWEDQGKITYLDTLGGSGPGKLTWTHWEDLDQVNLPVAGAVTLYLRTIGMYAACLP